MFPWWLGCWVRGWCTGYIDASGDSPGLTWFELDCGCMWWLAGAMPKDTGDDKGNGNKGWLKADWVELLVAENNTYLNITVC